MFEQIQNALLRIIGLISQKCLNRGEETGQQGICPVQIVRLARRQMKAGWVAQRIARGVRFWRLARPLTVRCTPFLCLPFCAGAVLMRTDDRGIDHRVFVVGVFRQMREHPLPHAGFAPARVARLDHPEISKPLR